MQLFKEKLSHATCEQITMIFTIDNKFAEVASRFWCAVTNCKSNTKK